MAKITVLGSRSGTEPFQGRHHTSVNLSIGGVNYLFDAGEDCSQTAHLLGIDLLKIKAVFISHTHYDHTGGIAGLFRNIIKLTQVKNRKLDGDKIEVYIHNFELFHAITDMLKLTEEGFDHDFEIVEKTITPGVIFTDENIKVTAYPNEHLPYRDNKPVSYSFLIEIGEKKICYSGDVKSLDELRPILSLGCDYLLCETGHHKVSDVCALSDEYSVKNLVFMHHGREILNDMPSVSEALSKTKIPSYIAYDGMSFEI